MKVGSKVGWKGHTLTVIRHDGPDAVHAVNDIGTLRIMCHEQDLDDLDPPQVVAQEEAKPVPVPKGKRKAK